MSSWAQLCHELLADYGGSDHIGVQRGVRWNDPSVAADGESIRKSRQTAAVKAEIDPWRRSKSDPPGPGSWGRGRCQFSH